MRRAAPLSLRSAFLPFGAYNMGSASNVIAELYKVRDQDSVLFTEPDGEALTTRQALGRIKHYAAVVASLGVVPGDRVSFRFEKSVENILLVHACLWAGAIVHPLNNAYTDHELAALLVNAAPKLLLCGSNERDRLEPLAQKAGCHIEVFAGLARQASFEPLELARTPSAEGAATLLYTSGTTGQPKGAVVTHQNLLHSAQSLVTIWQLNKDDILAHPLPVFHAHGLLTSINTMIAAGGSVLLLPGFETAALVAAFQACTVIMGVPTHYARLLDDPSFTRATAGKLRLAISGSAPLPIDLSRQFAETTGFDIIERYGSTETAIVVAVPPHKHAERIGWVGWPLPGVEIRIADQDGRRAAHGIGILETRGPHVFAGYWQNPRATSEAFTTDGWFITGDIAEIDTSGCVRMLGRERDLVISGGLNVYPVEIENELRRIDGIKEAAVFGVPHSDFGEAVVAAVELSQSTRDFNETQAIATVRSRLAAYKIPKRIFAVSQLPRNAMGKLLKARLRENYAGTFR
jgi:malonyl-CoA/methylmalonyl-CoA synthetase